MGVTIHYRGRLNNISLLPELEEELIDLAKSMGWNYVKFDDDWNEELHYTQEIKDRSLNMDGNLGLKGIAIIPPGSEPINFTVDPSGQLSSFFRQMSIIDKETVEAMDWVFCKTQFAEISVHIWIVELLKYLKKKYFHDLEVHDEGEYWETRKLKILQEKREIINTAMDKFSGAFESGELGDLKDASAEEIANSIEAFFKKYNDKRKKDEERK
ncbi:MAG: hypothetical protein ACLFQM_12800 [Fidelibacterota bacterium]